MLRNFTTNIYRRWSPTNKLFFWLAVTSVALGLPAVGKFSSHYFSPESSEEKNTVDLKGANVIQSPIVQDSDGVTINYPKSETGFRYGAREERPLSDGKYKYLATIQLLPVGTKAIHQLSVTVETQKESGPLEIQLANYGNAWGGPVMVAGPAEKDGRIQQRSIYSNVFPQVQKVEIFFGSEPKSANIHIDPIVSE